jgi:hypothetical protein
MLKEESLKKCSEEDAKKKSKTKEKASVRTPKVQKLDILDYITSQKRTFHMTLFIRFAIISNESVINFSNESGYIH